ncbi:hypothetical protein [Nocardioides litoris]|uniref:hypothetical protein n=1 Tax=Nocardioides litoris TaxID=1926648 RepID=UPI001B8791DF|nr:hypothetical protein [Nocardioides litoris]
MPAADPVDRAVAAALDGAREPVLVLADRPVAVPGDATVVGRGADKPQGQFRTVLLVAADVADLRATVASLAPDQVGWARVVVVVLAEADRAVTLRPDPAGPAVAALEAVVGWTRVELERRHAALPVLRALARAAVPGPAGVLAGHGGPRVGRPGEGFAEADRTVPPDLVVDPPEPPVVATATGRRPVAVGAADLGEAAWALDPLDEAVLRPDGSMRPVSRGVVDLPPGAAPSPALATALRDALGARTAPGPGRDRLVPGLALAGVPVLDADPPDWLPVDDLAPGGLPDADAGPEDRLRREELAVRQRRAAWAHRSSVAARAPLAATARVRARLHPSVSVVLLLDRPDHLTHALAQATRQRRAPTAGAPDLALEVLLAVHGLSSDPDLAEEVADVIEAASELSGLPVRTLPPPTDSPGPDDASSTGLRHVAGDLVLLLRGEDWWGPHTLVDLLLARAQSGADLVAVPDEVVHVPGTPGGPGGTVRRDVPTECAGLPEDGRLPAALLVDRLALLRLGGAITDLPARAARAGWTAYTAHGLGHVARAEHEPPGPHRARWDGFRPPSLLAPPGAAR